MDICSIAKLTSCFGDNDTSDEDSILMASPTSYDDSMVLATPGGNAASYDVFLSFRGEDTRDAFTDHLYDALGQAGLLTFRDNDELGRGRELKPEIERAIKASKASIVVLSNNYATSTWCLDELWLILEQRKESNHFVLPVFYHVDPSDVRRKNKSFDIKRVKKSTKWAHDNVKRWKAALTEVANLTGLVLSGPETEFLKVIVETIYNELDHKKVYLPPNLIGMDTRYEEIASWFNQPNLIYLAICGMGGSGKTTLAKYIYNLNQKEFEYVSFVEDIGSKCKGPLDYLKLQEQLIMDISGGKMRKVPSVSQGTYKIEEALQMKRALIVLDDIAEYSDIVTLLGNGKINAQSKIIITTENTGSLVKFSSHSCQLYKMKLLNDDEALKLLSSHTFGSEISVEGFKELAIQAVKYCEGNPLALEVLGSSLSESKTIPYWKSQLGVLEKDIHSRIEEVLERSYNSLPYKHEQQLFLHIACFFIGKDVDYVEKILELDCSAVSGIKTLTNRCLLSVSSSNKLMMHWLLQEMGRNIVRKESPRHPINRTRVWLSGDSYKILKKGNGSETIEGLTLDMKTLREDEEAFQSSDLTTDALNNMDNLKLLQLNFVELTGSHKNFSDDLRWLCWIGFHLRTIPSGLSMGKLVALDMSYSNLEVFEPPMVLQSLQILNLKDSYNLFEIRNISKIPCLETLILWNCHSLVRVCETIGDLTRLTLLNMSGCENLCNREQINLLAGLKASTSSEITKPPSLIFPHTLQRLFLKDCNLECSDSVPLSFSVQPFLQYLNLANSLFKLLPCYDHLKDLRVLDLSLCSRLKRLVCLPCTLAELYVYYCGSLEKITFESHRFTLQEFGYKGCPNLYEIEGFIKLLPIAKLDESDLGHMKWLKEYQSHEVFLVGDDELTIGRSQYIQMLYEFDIMSTSLPEIKDPNMTSEYISEPSSSSSLSFYVPPRNRRLKGLNITFKYTVSGDDLTWFAILRTTNGVDLIYNPKAFGRPEKDEVGIWLSYWPIGNKLGVGDQVNVSIVVMSGLVVYECSASLVYMDDYVVDETVVMSGLEVYDNSASHVYMDDGETLGNNMQLVETLGGDLSRFQLSTGAYYLCRHDFFYLMEVGRLSPGWLSSLVGDAIDDTEVRRWRLTGRPRQLIPSYTELKTVRCIVHGPQSEEIYKITEMPKSFLVDKNVEFTSSTLEDTMGSETTSEIGNAATKSASIQDEKLKSGDSHEVTDEASLMMGADSSFGDSRPGKKFVKESVDTIYNELDNKEVYLPPNLTGMDIRYNEIRSWLYQPNLPYLAICGMRGSGKTTLAKYIYNANQKKFENLSFVEDIGIRCQRSHGLFELQEQMLKDMVGVETRKLPSFSQSTFKIKQALQTKRTLVVLDGIVEYNELVALVGTGKINSQSKILITSENMEILFKFSPQRCQLYKMKLLNDDESLEHFSWHAFGSKIPVKGHKELAVQVVKYCEGNPLALEVWGSSLSKRNNIPIWKSQIEALKRDIDMRIGDVLKRSYNSLPYDSVKELFLHIACFFIGRNMDYVTNILEPDYSAVSGIKTLANRCLLSVSPRNKLMMHRLLQEMGRNIVCKESFRHPVKRSRVWLNDDSYKILKEGKGSTTVEGLTLDMKIHRKEEAAFKPSVLKTDALNNMGKLKLLQLNFVELTGSIENFSQRLRWLCWIGSNLRTIPSGLLNGNLVALDLSYSNLEVFEPPMVLQSLKILNLKDSHNLFKIHNIYRIPCLEILILWNCRSLVRVCESIKDLTSLVLLNMTGCKSLCMGELMNLSTSGEVTRKQTFSLPDSLLRLFLNDCKLEFTEFFSLSLSPKLQYLNLSNGLFEFLPSYGHLKQLQVLSLTYCSRLELLLCLPSTLKELYVNHCQSLKKITFQSHRFMLQEFSYEGCINLSEVEGFVKLVPVAKLDGSDLQHLKWLKKYQSYQVFLVGDKELSIGRSWDIQMLYEFDIMSISLPEIKDPNMTPEYISKTPFLSFNVPSCPKNRRLKGLNVTFKYTVSGDDWTWFVKIHSTNGVDLIYSPTAFGRPENDEVGIWLSYWPIENKLGVGDQVIVSIIVFEGLKVYECGASLVYGDEDVPDETLQNNEQWVETLGGDLSAFQLNTGGYYLCRRDFYKLMEVGRLTPGWLSILVGDPIDNTEVRGWRKTGRPRLLSPSFQS